MPGPDDPGCDAQRILPTVYDCPVSLARDDVRAALESFDRKAGDPEAASRHAAVCLLLVPAEDPVEIALVLTRRAASMRAHAGQWAFPGGRVDEGESVRAAALREVREEIGLTIDDSRVLGQLDDYVTRSGYLMTPVVAWAVDLPFTPRAGEDEVASIHRIPLREVDVEPRFLTIPESDRPVIQVPLGDRFVHAPTGAILHQFREVVMHGRSTRVAEFEQPVFAWK
jgi:8-oxo-dGTP pyrophosphatase MutT (NUDIX family)